jgi:hypothetical protein
MRSGGEVQKNQHVLNIQQKSPRVKCFVFSWGQGCREAPRIPVCLRPEHGLGRCA